MFNRTQYGTHHSHPDKTRHPIPPIGPRLDGKKTAPEAHVIHDWKVDETKKPTPPERRTTPVAVRNPTADEALKRTPPPESKPTDKIGTNQPFPW